MAIPQQGFATSISLSVARILTFGFFQSLLFGDLRGVKVVDYSRIDAEISNGRLWRAKEILTGRLASSNYDPALFGKLAIVLDGMRDDDEAGRYYLLSGATDGRGGELARHFLDSRREASVAQIWLTMPKAARRCDPSHTTPDGTIELLRAAEKLNDATQLPIEAVPFVKLSDLGKSGAPDSRLKERLIASCLAAGLCLIVIALILGLIEIGRFAAMVLKLIV